METLPETMEADSAFDEATDVAQGISLLDAVKAANLVPLLADRDVNRIGYEAWTEYQTDLETCTEFHERYDRAMEMAMQRPKPKTFPWTNASNVIFPLLTQAAIQFQARAYPAIIDGNAVVKGRVIGPDPEGKKAERAQRIAAHMNWQFLQDVPGWEEDTDKLLLQLPIVGCVLRKTWRDAVCNQNNSETISAKDFVVNIKTVSLDKAPRYTHRQRYYPHEIEAMIRSGTWARQPYDGDDGNDPHSLVEVLEQFRLIDMDDDGLAEPYVVTFTPDQRVFRIVACYDLEGIYVASDLFEGQKPLTEAMQVMAQATDMLAQAGNDAAAIEQATQSLRIVRIERKEYISKYGFIPAPDGSFYDIGFGTLTEALGAAVNTIINQLIDAGTLANMQGGFIAGGTKIKGGNMRFTPGEWKRVEGATSGPLRDNILPLQLPGPSAVLFQLLGTLIEAVQGITSVSDILSGNQESQTAPTTALALIEQGQKVFTAIYQRIHRALGVEINTMRRLNRDYLDEREYFALNDVQGEVAREDYQDRDLDVQPVSDPRAINDRIKMAKAAVLGEHVGDPLVNQVEIRKRKFEAAGINDIPALLKVPDPEPDPAALAEVARLEMEQASKGAADRAKDAETALTLIGAAKAAYELGKMIGDLNIQADTLRLLNEGMALADSVSNQMKGTGNEPAVQPGRVPAVEGEPIDAGVPAIPEGSPGQPVEGMGGGGTADFGGSAPGDSAGGLV